MLDAAQKYIWWKKLAEQYHHEESLKSELDDGRGSLLVGIYHAWDKETQKCGQKDLSAVQKLAQLARISLLIDEKDLAQQILQSINDKCSKLAMSFESKGQIGGLRLFLGVRPGSEENQV